MVPAYTGFDINTNYWQGCVFGTAGDEGEVSALMHESMGSSKYPDCDAFIFGPGVNFGR